MYNIRQYQHEDLSGCTQCFYEGFFSCVVDDNDRVFLLDYTQVMIEKSNFTYVAEADGQIVGFICGIIQKEFNSKLFKRFDYKQHWSKFVEFTAKYYLNRYKLSNEFDRAFKLFFSKVQERKNFPLGKCDCELAALSSRKDYRKGLGTALVNEFVARCSQNNIKSIRLFTNTDATYTFYDKYVFTKIEDKAYSITGAVGKSIIYELQL